jgi:hypothetical protein
VDHGEDTYRHVSEFVDRSVAVEEALAHIGAGKFRYGTPELGVRRQFVSRSNRRSTTCWAW